MSKDNLIRFAFVALLGASAALVSSVITVTSEPDIAISTEIEEAGLFFNRGDKTPRTAPVDPAAPTSPAPSFEAPPVEGVPPAAAATPAALSPEQKDQLKGIVVQLVTLLAGAFLGSGSASPFLKLILEKLLGAVGGATPSTPARTTVRRKKAAAKS